MEQAKVSSRRRHGAQLKEQVLAKCAEASASVAAVALADGLNTNLVHEWRREANGRPRDAGATAMAIFIPVAVAPSGLPPASDIRIELRRAGVAVNVAWPREAAAECAGWLRELPR
jgi:transposase